MIAENPRRVAKRNHERKKKTSRWQRSRKMFDF